MGHVSPIGLICGLKLEAAIARKSGFDQRLIRIAGPGAIHAKKDVAALAAAGAKAIISFGLAGGLNPALAPGSLIIAQQINWLTDEGKPYGKPCDAALHSQLAEQLSALSPTITDCLAWSATPIMSCEAKAALRITLDQFLDTETAAVDMESGPLQQAAEDAALPFATIRVIADPADQAISPVLAHAVTADGGIQYGAIIGGLLHGKVRMSELLALQKYNKAANDMLAKIVSLLTDG